MQPALQSVKRPHAPQLTGAHTAILDPLPITAPLADGSRQGHMQLQSSKGKRDAGGEAQMRYSAGGMNSNLIPAPACATVGPLCRLTHKKNMLI